MRRLTLIIFMLFFVGCECSPEEIARPPRSADTAATTDVVPTSARALIKVERLDGLLDILAAISTQTAEDSFLRSSRERFRNTLAFDLFSAEDWQGMGIDVASPATIFEDGDHWIMHATVRSEKTLAAWFETANKHQNFKVITSDVEGFTLHRLGFGDKDIAGLFVATNAEHAFVIPVGRTQPRWPQQLEPGPLTVEEVKSRLKRWLNLGRAERWSKSSFAKRIEATLEKKPIVATIRPRTWMPSANEDENAQASVIYRRIRNQLGPVGVGLSFDPVGRRIDAKIAMNTDPREPTFVQDLQGASGRVPPLGGLIDPGVLGSARLSVDPRKFYNLMRSMLPAQLRAELDEIIAEYDSELAIDVVDDILSIVNGHVVAVFYGFEPDILTRDNPNLLADLFRLRATREALLIPIKSRDRMEDILNAATQLSKGKLNRQDTGDSIQYAWIDGGLQWATILGKDHVILVDSTAAFDHAVAYERNARPLGQVMRDKGLDRLFAGQNRSGIYLDSQSLSNLMAESGNAEIAAWLRPFSSILLTAEGADAELELVLDD